MIRLDHHSGVQNFNHISKVASGGRGLTVCLSMSLERRVPLYALGKPTFDDHSHAPVGLMMGFLPSSAVRLHGKGHPPGLVVCHPVV